MFSESSSLYPFKSLTISNTEQLLSFEQFYSIERLFYVPINLVSHPFVFHKLEWQYLSTKLSNISKTSMTSNAFFYTYKFSFTSVYCPTSEQGLSMNVRYVVRIAFKL